MKSFYLILFILFNSFQTNNAFNYNKNIVNKNIVNKNIVNKNIVNKNIVMNIDTCPDYLNKFTKFINEEQSELIVKSITGFLTKVDSFGGYVLHSNDVIINCILNNDLLPLEQKKSIILFFIKLSQYGDSTGSHILQLYHDIVNCLL